MKHHVGLCIAIALCATLAVQGGDDDEWEYESESDSQERQVEIEVEQEKVEIKATVEKKNKTSDTEREDTLQWQIETRSEDGPKGGMEMKFSYAVEKETKTTETETELTFRVRIGKIIEFKGTPIYNKTTSTVVKEYMMSSWAAFVRTERNGIHEFSASTSDGVVTVLGRVSPKAVVDADSTKISPDAVKIDIRVKDFPYQETGTKLCMVGKLKTKMEVEAEIDEDDDRRLSAGRRLDDDDDEDDFEIENPQLAALRKSAGSAIPVGKFDWKKSIKGDSKHYAVKTLQKQEKEDGDDDDPQEKNYMMYFTFDTATEVAAPPGGGGGAFGMATTTVTTTTVKPSTAVATTAAATTTDAGTTTTTAAATTTTTAARRLAAGHALRTPVKDDAARRLGAVPSVALFVWDPTIGVAYKKAKAKTSTSAPKAATAATATSGSDSLTSGAKPQAGFWKAIVAALLGTLVFAFL